MANDEVGIYNMALNAIGARDNISAPTEESREAEVCGLWFPTVRDQVLRAAPWPSARGFARLALASERDFGENWTGGDPAPGFAFAYLAPAGMLQPLHLSDYARFSHASFDSGRAAIMTNSPEAILHFNRRQTVIEYWDVSLKMAIVYALAAAIAMPLSGKDRRAAKLAEQANELIVAARTNAANSDNTLIETVPDWFQKRGYAGAQPTEQFIYPYGSLIAVETAGVR